jgi:hypothetical protein
MTGDAQPPGEHVSGSRSVRVLTLAAAVAVSVLAIFTPATASPGGLSAESSNPPAYSGTVNSGPTEFW